MTHLDQEAVEALLQGGLSASTQADLDFFNAKLAQGLKIPACTPEEEREHLTQALIEAEEEIASLRQQLQWAEDRSVRLEFQLDTAFSVLRLVEAENHSLKEQIATLTGDTRKLT